MGDKHRVQGRSDRPPGRWRAGAMATAGPLGITGGIPRLWRVRALRSDGQVVLCSAVAAFTLSSRSLGAKGLGSVGQEAAGLPVTSGWCRRAIGCAAGYRCALHVSREAGQVVGGRLPRPHEACGGPAGCWPRGRRQAGGGPGLQGWVDRWLGQPCPGLVGDGAGLVALGQWKQASGLDAGRRPWRPSWVAVRAGGRAGAEIRGDVEAPAWPLYLGLLPGRVDLRVP